MRTALRPAAPSRFLGVRLSEEEGRLLEEFRRARELSTTSDAVRALVRESATPRASSIDLPVTLRGEIEALVEDGRAANLEAAYSTIAELGLGELGRTFETLTRMRSAARGDAQRRQVRQRADREGRGLLRR